MEIIWIVFGIALGVGRFFIEPRLDLPTITGSYEAIVHLYLGILLGPWLLRKRRWSLWLVGGLTLLEVVLVVVQKQGYL